MKTRFIKVTFVVAIAMIGAINVFNTNRTETLSDIALANVEGPMAKLAGVVIIVKNGEVLQVVV